MDLTNPNEMFEMDYSCLPLNSPKMSNTQLLSYLESLRLIFGCFDKSTNGSNCINRIKLLSLLLLCELLMSSVKLS